MVQGVIPAVEAARGVGRNLDKESKLGKAAVVSYAVQGVAEVVATAIMGVAGARKISAPKKSFVEQMSPAEAARYERYWKQNYSESYKNEPNTRQRLQVQPGLRSITDQKLSNTGELYSRQTVYDPIGRKIGNNDYSTHGRPQQHTNPHHHVNPVTDVKQHSSPIPGLHPETPQ